MTPAHAPANHPRIPPKKTGILIANLGTPDGYDYWSMRRYLNEFLSDRRVIDYPAWKWQPLLQGIILTKRPFTSGRNYKLIWNEEKNESPLMTITRSQTEALRERASAEWGDQVMVEFCMRYGNPSTQDVLDRMVKAGCQRIVFLPLYPQARGLCPRRRHHGRPFPRPRRSVPCRRDVRSGFPDRMVALGHAAETAAAGIGHDPT